MAGKGKHEDKKPNETREKPVQKPSDSVPALFPGQQGAYDSHDNGAQQGHAETKKKDLCIPHPLPPCLHLKTQSNP